MRTLRNRRYRRRLPALLRRVLYPDALTLHDLRRRTADVVVDVTFPSREVDTPQAAELDVWPAAKSAARARYVTPEYFSLRLRGAKYDPLFNLVTTQSGAALIDSSSTFLPLTLQAWQRRFRTPSRRIEGLCTIFRSVDGNFYHTLIEDLSRVFLLRQPVYREMGTIKMLFPSEPTALEQYLLDRYLPDNIEIDVVGRDQIIEPDELILPSFLTRQSVTYLPQAFVDDLLPRLLPQRARNKRRRIYITRRPGPLGHVRLIENDEQLWQALRTKGFERYALEDLSFDEQIALFYDAEMVVAAHGAGLANLLFAEAIDVIELHAGALVVPYFYYMSASLGHRYQWWNGDRQHFNASFTVDVSAVMGMVDAALDSPPDRVDNSAEIGDVVIA